jgi:REP-associated tyrosine transposase
MRTHSRVVIAHHVILHGYGHWLPNDPRGSGSDEVRKESLVDLGSIHHGRKRVQPSRDELRRFYREAEPRLEHELLWFDAAKRQALADACEKLARMRPYTVWACAIMTNHVHLCVRRHRNSGEEIWDDFARITREALFAFNDVPRAHRVWSNRPYAVFLYTPEEVRRCVQYIEDNPAKSNLPAQCWPFVALYDGWPYC